METPLNEQAANLAEKAAMLLEKLATNVRQFESLFGPHVGIGLARSATFRSTIRQIQDLAEEHDQVKREIAHERLLALQGDESDGGHMD